MADKAVELGLLMRSETPEKQSKMRVQNVIGMKSFAFSMSAVKVKADAKPMQSLVELN